MTSKIDLNRTYVPGDEIEWRRAARDRKWHRAFAVGRRNTWVIVRLASGDEIEVHPSNVRPVKK